MQTIIILPYFTLFCVLSETTYDSATTCMTARHYFSGTKALHSTHSHLYCPQGRNDCCCHQLSGYNPFTWTHSPQIIRSFVRWSHHPCIQSINQSINQSGMSLMQQLDRTTQHLSAVDLNNLQMLETTLIADRSPYLVYYKGGWVDRLTKQPRCISIE